MYFAIFGERFKKTLVIFSIVLFLVSMTGCNAEKTNRQVVVYTSVDQVFSEPVFKEFEKKTGIKVLPVYDVEATKTTGLVNRLIAEKSFPKADVFWSGELVQTLLLKEKEVLQTYNSPAGKDIPTRYIDPDGSWTAFGGRARVLLVNKNMIKPVNYPKSIFDLLNPEYPADKIGIAYPVFGTTATHAAAFYAANGQEKGREFFKQLKARGVQVVDGNSVVRDMVVSGRLMMGLTDTDDAGAAIKKGQPVEMVFLDQGKGEMGTLINPNTVAMIKNTPHPGEARELIDYLVSREVENRLLAGGWIDLTIRPAGAGDKQVRLEVKGMNVSFQDIYDQLETSKKDMTEIFVK